MYRLYAAVVLLLAPVALTTSCHGPTTQSTIRMSDLHTQKQLISGFYDLEGGAWRWTGGQFRVLLRVPEEVEKDGGTLTLQGAITPETVANRPLEIVATIAGQPLAPASFSKSGELIYRAAVPAGMLHQTAIAAYVLSSTHRVPGDSRDLGVIASVISLRAK